MGRYKEFLLETAEYYDLPIPESDKEWKVLAELSQSLLVDTNSQKQVFEIDSIEAIQGCHSKCQEEVSEYRMMGHTISETSKRFSMAPAVVRQLDIEFKEES